MPSSIGTKTSSLLIVLSLGLSMKVLLFCTLVRAEPTKGKEKKLCGQGHVTIQTRKAKKGEILYRRGFKSIRKLTHFLHGFHMSQCEESIEDWKGREKKDISGGNRGLKTISHFLVQTSIFLAVGILKNHHKTIYELSLYPIVF